MSKKNHEPNFLRIYKKLDGKETFEPYRVEPKETPDPNDATKTVKTFQLVTNEFVRFKAMNRRARLVVQKEKRLKDKKFYKAEAELTVLDENKSETK